MGRWTLDGSSTACRITSIRYAGLLEGWLIWLWWGARRTGSSDNTSNRASFSDAFINSCLGVSDGCLRLAILIEGEPAKLELGAVNARLAIEAGEAGIIFPAKLIARCDDDA